MVSGNDATMEDKRFSPLRGARRFAASLWSGPPVEIRSPPDLRALALFIPRARTLNTGGDGGRRTETRSPYSASTWSASRNRDCSADTSMSCTAPASRARPVEVEVESRPVEVEVAPVSDIAAAIPAA